MPMLGHPLKSHILALIKSGRIASLSEAALIADVAPVTVFRWLKAIRADLGRLRLAEIAKLRREAQLRLERYQARLSRQSRKRARYDAIRRFNRSNGHH